MQVGFECSIERRRVGVEDRGEADVRLGESRAEAPVEVVAEGEESGSMIGVCVGSHEERETGDPGMDEGGREEVDVQLRRVLAGRDECATDVDAGMSECSEMFLIICVCVGMECESARQRTKFFL